MVSSGHRQGVRRVEAPHQSRCWKGLHMAGGKVAVTMAVTEVRLVAVAEVPQTAVVLGVLQAAVAAT